MVRFKLDGSGYKIHDRGPFTRPEIKAIVMHFTAQDMILELLNERYMEMKEKVKEILS